MRGVNPEGPLDELAAFLATPARSGIYLTRNELVALARLADGSLRVGERRRMLADVLKSAPSREALCATLAWLQEFCRESLRGYRELVEASPASAVQLRPWIGRAEATLDRLTTLIAEIRL